MPADKHEDGREGEGRHLDRWTRSGDDAQPLPHELSPPREFFASDGLVVVFGFSKPSVEFVVFRLVRRVFTLLVLHDLLRALAEQAARATR